MTRWVHEAIMEEMAQRVAAQPEQVNARQSLVEHPFGTMKRGMDHGDFLPRGLAKVRGERRLTVLVYQSSSRFRPSESMTEYNGCANYVEHSRFP